MLIRQTGRDPNQLADTLDTPRNQLSSDTLVRVNI
jgi:hypothetical protein